MDVSILFNPGIYQIKCLQNNKIYIGESSNLFSRIGRHCDNLENNRHDCFALQNDFNKYGKKAFVFLILKQGLSYQNDIIRKNEERKLIQNISKKFRYNSIEFEQSFYAQGVKINNKIYPSLNNAAIELNESRTNIVRKCIDEKNTKYVFIKSTLGQKYSFKKACPCKIEGNFYKSLAQAGKALNLSHKTIKNRILSKKYPNYVFKVNRSNDYPIEE